MEKNIFVKVKGVYGADLIYPDCEVSKILCSLTNAKTFTAQAMMKIKSLGYVVNVRTPEVKGL